MGDSIPRRRMEVEWCLTKGRQPKASTKRAKLKKQWMRGGRQGCEAICMDCRALDWCAHRSIDPAWGHHVAMIRHGNSG